MSVTRRYWFGLLNIRVVKDKTWKESQGGDHDFDKRTFAPRFEFIFVLYWRASDTIIKVAIDSNM
jgi:hypothetical protein